MELVTIVLIGVAILLALQLLPIALLLVVSVGGGIVLAVLYIIEEIKTYSKVTNYV